MDKVFFLLVHLNRGALISEDGSQNLNHFEANRLRCGLTIGQLLVRLGIGLLRIGSCVEVNLAFCNQVGVLEERNQEAVDLVLTECARLYVVAMGKDEKGVCEAEHHLE